VLFFIAGVGFCLSFAKHYHVLILLEQAETIPGFEAYVCYHKIDIEFAMNK
jgi:hypothetical protein